MLGAIIGDMLGVPFEFRDFKSKEFTLFENSTFSDDTVMTVAIAKSFLEYKGDNAVECMEIITKNMQYFGLFCINILCKCIFIRI
jgi:ADP-ribosylglycohydrolase